MGRDGVHQRRSVGCPSPLTSVTAAGYSPLPAQQMSTTVYSGRCVAVTPHTVSSSCEEMESFSSLASLSLSIQDCSCRRTFFCQFPPPSDWPPSRSHSRRLTSASSPGGGHQPHPATFVNADNSFLTPCLLVHLPEASYKPLQVYRERIHTCRG